MYVLGRVIYILQLFYEVHSIHLPRATKSIPVKYINKKHIAVLGKNELVYES